MVNKIFPGLDAAVAGIQDGATIMIGGFGNAGMPRELIDALIAQGASDLTIVNNNAGNGDTGLAALLAAGRVRKIICSFPRQADSHVFDGLYRSGKPSAGVPACAPPPWANAYSHGNFDGQFRFSVGSGPASASTFSAVRQ